MSKEELEREAGGAIFTSNNEETRNQVENTRYRGSGQTTSSRVASGATETRLTDGDRQQGGIGPGMESSNDQLYGANSGYRSSYDYEKTFQSGSIDQDKLFLCTNRVLGALLDTLHIEGAYVDVCLGVVGLYVSLDFGTQIGIFQKVFRMSQLQGYVSL